MTDADLRRLAERAIPGWELDAAYLRRDEALDIDVAAYIAAANPQTILALLDERDEALAGGAKALFRVAALEEGLRAAAAYIKAVDDHAFGGWSVHGKAIYDDIAALLAAAPSGPLRLGQQVAAESHLPADIQAKADSAALPAKMTVYRAGRVNEASDEA